MAPPTLETQCLDGHNQQDNETSDEPWQTFTLNMSEDLWNLREADVKNAMDEANTSQVSLPFQLWRCCSEDLQQRLSDLTCNQNRFTQPDQDPDPDGTMLKVIKKVAVTNKTAPVVLRSLLYSVQKSTESTADFITRVRDQANSCGMTVKCTMAGCHTDVSFLNEVVQQVIIHGLSNLELKKRILSRSDNGDLDTLSKLVSCISNIESTLAKTSRQSTSGSSISNSGNVGIVPLLSQTILCKLVKMITPVELWLVQETKQQEFFNMKEDLRNHFTVNQKLKPQSTHNWKPLSMCAVKTSETGWARAQILSVDECKVHLLLGDHANTVQMNIHELYLLPKKFMETTFYSFKVNIPNISGTWIPVEEELHTCLLNPITVEVTNLIYL